MNQEQFNSMLASMLSGSYIALRALEKYFKSEPEDYQSSDIFTHQKAQAYDFCLKNKDTNSFATLFYGRCLEEGWGVVSKDAFEAAKAYLASAQMGNPVGDYYLGSCHYFGCGIPQNDAYALNGFTKAANAGYGLAQYWLGYMQFFGIGLARKNYPAAMESFLKASRNGEGAASRMIGTMYENGYGVDKPCDTQAKEWYNKAISQGYDAQFYIKQMQDAKKYNVANPFVLYVPKNEGLAFSCEPIVKTQYSGYADGSGNVSLQSWDIVDEYTLNISFGGQAVAKRKVPNYFRTASNDSDRAKSKNPNSYQFMKLLILIGAVCLALGLAEKFTGFSVTGIPDSLLQTLGFIFTVVAGPCLCLTACCCRIKLNAHGKMAKANQLMLEQSIDMAMQADQQISQAINAQSDKMFQSMRASFPGLSLSPQASLPPQHVSIQMVEMKTPPSVTYAGRESQSLSWAQTRQQSPSLSPGQGQMKTLVAQRAQGGMISVQPVDQGFKLEGGVSYIPPVGRASVGRRG